MKFVALLSGGKDSCFSAMLATDAGHELVCLANLYPGRGSNGDEINSFMYQSAAHVGIPYLAECFGKPLVRRQILGKSLDQSLSYSNGGGARRCGDYDEVEDLYLLLRDVKLYYPEVEGVCCGAIISNYQRHRVENVCERLGLTSLSYLWELNRPRLLQDIVDRGVHAVLVKVAGMGLLPRQHLGKSLAELSYSLHRYHEKYGLDVCGEGGEFETFVLDCPLFRRWRLVLDETDLLLDEEDDTIGSLYLTRCHLEDKVTGEALDSSAKLTVDVIESVSRVDSSPQQPLAPVPAMADRSRGLAMPSFSVNVDGLGSTGLIYDAAGTTDDIGDQMHNIFGSLVDLFGSLHGAGSECFSRKCELLKDTIFVQMYLSDMALFPAANAVYRRYFGTVSPPSRACVAIPLPGDAKVALAVTFYLRSHPATYFLSPVVLPSSEACTVEAAPSEVSVAITHEEVEGERAVSSNRFNLQRRQLAKRRSVLHVSSVSNWAPVCIGPYSQCNAINSSMVLYLAGQIGLNAGTMEIESSMGALADEMKRQLRLCIQHCHRVLACLQCLRWRQKENSSNVGSVVLYISRDAVLQWKESPGNLSAIVGDLCRVLQACVRSYHGVGQEYTDAVAERKSGDCDGSEYEDENSDNESPSSDSMCAAAAVPVIVVEVASLPRGALVEVEVLALNKAKMGFAQAVESNAEVGAAVLAESVEDGSCVIEPAAGAAVEAPSDPLRPLHTLLGADALGDTNRFAAPAALDELRLHALAASVQSSVGSESFVVVGHHWKFSNCCAVGAVDCVGRVPGSNSPVLSDGGYYRVFVAALKRVREIVMSATADGGLRLTDQALLTIRVFHAGADAQRLEQIGCQAVRDVFPAFASEVRGFAPVVTFVPACAVYSASEWLLLECAKPSVGGSAQERGAWCCCQFSAVDTVQLKTMSWINVD